MGPVQSFKSSYEENLKKRRKRKHKPFDNDISYPTIETDFKDLEMTEELKSEIQTNAKRERFIFKRNLFIVIISKLILLGMIYSMFF